MKSQELFALLTRDRANEATTTRQQIAYRSQAEVVLGPEENLYRIEFVSTCDSLKALGVSDRRLDCRSRHPSYSATGQRGSNSG